MTNPNHLPIGRFTIQQGQYHLMAAASGQQFAVNASRVAAFGTRKDHHSYALTRAPLPEKRRPGATNPTVVPLRRFWAQQGYDVWVFGATRVASAKVLGQLHMVRVNTRWFTPTGVYGSLGGCYVIEEADGEVRLLRPSEFPLEFS